MQALTIDPLKESSSNGYYGIRRDILGNPNRPGAQRGLWLPGIHSSACRQHRCPNGKPRTGRELQWLGEWPTLIALSIATVGDVIAHEFPVVDDVLNVVEAPLVPIAATILSVSLLTDMDPLLKWGLAAIAGGGSAGALHVARSFLKSLLNASTAGVSTPVVSLVEDAAALVTPILVILAPVFVLFLFLVVVGVTALALKKWMGKRRRSPLRPCIPYEPQGNGTGRSRRRNVVKGSYSGNLLRRLLFNPWLIRGTTDDLRTGTLRLRGQTPVTFPNSG